MTTIYHNPQCRKSRETLRLLEEKGERVQVIEYLKATPTKSELRKVIELLGISPEQLVRKGEEVYKTTFKGKKLTDEEWLDALIAYPKLIERPVVVKNGKAAIGRPPETVLEIL